MFKRRILIGVFPIFLIGVAISLYNWLNWQAVHSRKSASNISVEFRVKKGEGSSEVGANLEKKGLIENKYFFYYYVWKTKTNDKIQAGTYELAPDWSIKEIVEKLTQGKVKPKIIKLVVPEGFTNQKIIARLEKEKPNIANEFAELANCRCINQAGCACDKFSARYDFVKNLPANVDLEGYLFPDTYFIGEKESGFTLVDKFLKNFQKKVVNKINSGVVSQPGKLHEIITLASIVEREVKTKEDKEIVAGIFERRLADGHPLQSCATLAYALGIDKTQFSIEDTQINSPYNTYQKTGLPPGPIANPGLESIWAVIHPRKTEYYYFLSNPQTGKIIYSKTAEEHSSNKKKNGL
jgi:UPF0755 protein